MKKSIAKKWVAALRSGEFKQTKSKLESPNGNCCLGVLCNLALLEGICDYSDGWNGDGGPRFDNHLAVLPISVQIWAGIKSAEGALCLGKSAETFLTDLNDNEGFSFKRIATIIEKNWRKL